MQRTLYQKIDTLSKTKTGASLLHDKADMDGAFAGSRDGDHQIIS